MRARLFAGFLFVSIALGGGQAIGQSSPTATTSPATFDACTLLQKKDVEAVVGSPIKDTKSSERLDGDFRMSQCFYTATEFSRSITLTVFQKHPTDSSKRTPIEFWKHTFARYEEDEAETKEDKKEEGKKEDAGKKEPNLSKERGREEEEGAPPRKIDKLGDEAFWLSNRFGGTLYVLKGNAFFSISLGGTDSEPVKIDKSKKLASKALPRFKAQEKTVAGTAD
jgi:hypothetical protein